MDSSYIVKFHLVTIRYSEAYKKGKKQEKIMQEIMKISNIEEIWNSKEIENQILSMIIIIKELVISPLY
jgi:hypothetical protein